MLVAALLSDLTSLQACDPAAALALVTAHKNLSKSSQDAEQNVKEQQSKDNDPDIARAHKLLNLHEQVKLAYTSTGGIHSTTPARDLLEATRLDVRNAVESLGISTRPTSSTPAANSPSVNRATAGTDNSTANNVTEGEDEEDDVDAWA